MKIFDMSKTFGEVCNNPIFLKGASLGIENSFNLGNWNQGSKELYSKLYDVPKF